MPLRREPEAFDRVGDDHRGASVVDLRVGLAQRVEIMAAEIANRLGENQIVEVADERRDRRGIGTFAGQPVSDAEHRSSR